MGVLYTQFKQICFRFWKVEKARRWMLVKLNIYTSYLLRISIPPFLLSLEYLRNCLPITVD